MSDTHGMHKTLSGRCLLVEAALPGSSALALRRFTFVFARWEGGSWADCLGFMIDHPETMEGATYLDEAVAAERALGPSMTPKELLLVTPVTLTLEWAYPTVPEERTLASVRANVMNVVRYE